MDGTPAFFVNDLRHEGGYSVRELLAVVDEAAAAWPTGLTHLRGVAGA